MNKKLQVFVSSTYSDLIAERQAAVEAILCAGHIPAGMELFTAGDEAQTAVIRKWIDDSDVYMLILGGRYGSKEPKSGKSYTQLEYEYAVRKNKPLFALFMSDDYLDRKVKQEGPSVTERSDTAALEAFRKNVLGRICKSFDTLDGLKFAVLQSLNTFASDEALVGWVKGSEVIDTKTTLEQVTRLQSENDRLRGEVEQLREALAVQERPPIRDVLNNDTKELLVAGKKSRGRIRYIDYLNDAILEAGGKNFFGEDDNPREKARWKAALDQLEEYRLIVAVGSKRQVFELTKLGYDVVDEIETLTSGTSKAGE